MFSCSNLGKYDYQPMPNVKIQVILKDLDHHYEDSTKWVSLVFDYKIINESKNPIYFKFDSIKIQFNGNISAKVFINSIASIIATRKRLQNGENDFSLYALFSDSVKVKKHNVFKILSYGFVK